MLIREDNQEIASILVLMVQESGLTSQPEPTAEPFLLWTSLTLTDFHVTLHILDIGFMQYFQG